MVLVSAIIYGGFSLLQYKTDSMGEWFLTFQGIVASSSSMVKHSNLGSFRSQEPLTQQHGVISQ